jgi:hypothetical protein
MREREAAKAYTREFGAAMLVYMVVLVGAIYLGKRMDDGIARTLVVVSPMIGFMLAVWAVARHIGRIDEYMRKLVLESIAIAAAVTAGWTFTYGFLEGIGFPRLSMFIVWPVMGAVWFVICVLRYYQDKRT